MSDIAFAKEQTENLDQLASHLEGSLHYDSLLRSIYATDASVYRELPLAVAYPKNSSDLKKLIDFANRHQTSLIPRAGGTSLAGQCVGNGIVVDISKHFTKIIEFNETERWIRVEPGVVRDELNAFLKPYGLFFSPITSTANRATIGGMVGNNSSGTTSIQYGTTREHTLEVKALLSDGAEVTFSPLSKKEFEAKCSLDSLEGEVYRHIRSTLTSPRQQALIREHFPKPEIHRRNTGYALDILLDSEAFSDSDKPFNFCKLLCGSEGTLAFTTEIKLHLDPLPPPFDVVVAAHFKTINECMVATQKAMEYQPDACELMDKIILDCTKGHLEYEKNRFFIEGNPRGVLMVEFRGPTLQEAHEKADTMIAAMQTANLGYAYPKIESPRTTEVWKLRSAGLGLLANIPGDKKAVACIEDTAVALEDLAEYIGEFTEMMKRFGQDAVYYAHAGAGEIHLRPILDLKKSEDVRDFYEISKASAELVKKYQGSLSGEHGDGRVRAAFIPLMVGAENYQTFRQLKYTWDPNGIFNSGKIVDAEPMDSSLRYKADIDIPEFQTFLDFSDTKGILRLAEKCNGSGDCRKLPLSGGTMCPSFMATRNEKDTTRARANALREVLTRQGDISAMGHKDLKKVMDLCLSCKGCTSECPSQVDVSSMKAEFQYQYHKIHGIPLRSRVFAHISDLNTWNSKLPRLSNVLLSGSLSSILKKQLRIAAQRSLPPLHSETLRSWYKKNTPKPQGRKVYLFCDEFTNYNDTPIGIKAIQLLSCLGYQVVMIKHDESGRAALSKGLLEKARKHAEANVEIFSSLLSENSPLLGIEPSAILSFRDEYPKLVRPVLAEKAKKIADHCLLIDEFIYREFEAGHILPSQFQNNTKHIVLHGHCHQKALSNVSFTQNILSIPENYSVEVIPSGCCGMAGSFGYEKEHYDVSMQIGELVLFPFLRNIESGTCIAAPGTSCRHQIADGTGKKAVHPVEVLYEALL